MNCIFWDTIYLVVLVVAGSTWPGKEDGVPAGRLLGAGKPNRLAFHWYKNLFTSIIYHYTMTLFIYSVETVSIGSSKMNTVFSGIHCRALHVSVLSRMCFEMPRQVTKTRCPTGNLLTMRYLVL
jgi:hypothetical protein